MSRWGCEEKPRGQAKRHTAQSTATKATSTYLRVKWKLNCHVHTPSGISPFSLANVSPSWIIYVGRNGPSMAATSEHHGTATSVVH